MEESGLVILIVTMSDKKCVPFASGPIFQVCRIQTTLIVIIWHSRGRKFIHSGACFVWTCHGSGAAKHGEGLVILRLYREKKGGTSVWHQPCGLTHSVPLAQSSPELQILGLQLCEGAQPAWVSGVTLEKGIWCVPISSLFHRGNLWIWEERPGNNEGANRTKTAVMKSQESCHRLNPIPSCSNISLPQPLLQIMLSFKEAFFSPKQNTIFLRKAQIKWIKHHLLQQQREISIPSYFLLQQGKVGTSPQTDNSNSSHRHFLYHSFRGTILKIN